MNKRFKEEIICPIVGLIIILLLTAGSVYAFEKEFKLYPIAVISGLLSTIAMGGYQRILGSRNGGL